MPGQGHLVGRDGQHVAPARPCSYGSNTYQPNAFAALLAPGEQIAGAEQYLHDLIRDLIDNAVAVGAIRDDSPADELAAYCLHALAAAGSLPTTTAVDRLVAVIWGRAPAAR